MVAVYGIAFVLTLSALAWRRKPSQAGFCAKCGYNLTANVSGTCPECGTPVTQKATA